MYVTRMMALCKPNKYSKWYFEIISKGSKTKPAKGYTESHHILPKAFGLGGETDSNNLVYLTARAHFVAHLLLPKMMISKRHHFQMLEALAYFSHNKNRQVKYNSRELAWIREANSKASSERNSGNKNYLNRDEKKPQTLKKKRENASRSKWVNDGEQESFTMDHMAKIQEGWSYGRLKFSKEWKDKVISNFPPQKGVPKSDSHKQAIKDSAYERTSEHRKKVGETLHQKKTCEYCGKESTLGNYTRWHGEKCKHRPLQNA